MQLIAFFLGLLSLDGHYTKASSGSLIVLNAISKNLTLAFDKAMNQIESTLMIKKSKHSKFFQEKLQTFKTRLITDLGRDITDLQPSPNTTRLDLADHERI